MANFSITPFVLAVLTFAFGTFGLASNATAKCYFLECDETTSQPSPPTPQPQYNPPGAPPPPLPQEPRKTSYWNHNGSIMYLVVNGDRREFYYSQPRPGMVAEGVTPGTLLFSGLVAGNGYQGTAYLFSARCGRRSYPVSGTIEEIGGRVVMMGTATNVDSRCHLKSLKNDVLVFEYLYSR